MNKTKFYAIIKLFEFHKDGNDERCGKLLRSLIDNGTIEDVQAFEKKFSEIHKEINKETTKRIEQNKRVFAKGVSHGMDDCHFMDMPPHLISLGKEVVERYLKGGLIHFSPYECFSYMFQDIEELNHLYK